MVNGISKNKERMKMVKGINKRMVVLRMDGNSIYDSAWFILKNEPKAKSEADKDMLAEANRIIFESDVQKRKKPRRFLRVLLLVALFLVGAASGFCVALFFM